MAKRKRSTKRKAYGGSFRRYKRGGSAIIGGRMRGGAAIIGGNLRSRFLTRMTKGGRKIPIGYATAHYASRQGQRSKNGTLTEFNRFMSRALKGQLRGRPKAERQRMFAAAAKAASDHVRGIR